MDPEENARKAHALAEQKKAEQANKQKELDAQKKKE